MRREIPLKRAMRGIVLSTLLISGGAAFFILYFFHIREVQLQDEVYHIVAIEHSGELDAQYLAELLQLSQDRPTNLHAFNLQEGKRRLEESPVIQAAEIRKKPPNVLLVEYQLRHPVATLVDWDNAAIDREGVVIPLHPFFDGSGLPEIVRGDVAIKWDALPLGGKFKRIDLSRMHAQSFGRREVVLIVEDLLLRLRPETMEEQLKNFELLREHLPPDAKIVDLRISDLAFVESNMLTFQKKDPADVRVY